MKRDKILKFMKEKVNYDELIGDNKFRNQHHIPGEFIELLIDYDEKLELMIIKIKNKKKYNALDLEETLNSTYNQFILKVYKLFGENEYFEIAIEMNWVYYKDSNFKWVDDRYYYMITKRLIKKSIMEKKVNHFKPYFVGGEMGEYYRKILYEYR